MPLMTNHGWVTFSMGSGYGFWALLHVFTLFLFWTEEC